jgi:phenylalanyl-tRNA synthetase beta chain
MGVSTNWLKKYVNYTWSADELAQALTMAGIAIEGVDDVDGDKILDLDLTPNRGDCLGMINLAREVAALTGTHVVLPEIKIQESADDISSFIKVEIKDPDLCGRYAARAVKNVKIGPSPEWMQEALLHSGIRPINNVVDVTNYVMLETNQPLHAFDYSLLEGDKRIVVRRAVNGEQFTTLDDVERHLESSMLVITDGHRPVALAGVMGGQNTEISDTTTTVLLESANFNPVNTRRTSHQLALRSDSSIRFEKGVDINGTIFAINRATQLIQELAGGEVVSGICDVYPNPQSPLTISLRSKRVNALLGTDLSTDDIIDYLQRLSLVVKKSETNDTLQVVAPTYRPDLQIEEDLIEEIARLHGYNLIPSQLPKGASTGGLTSYQNFQVRTRNTIASSMEEVINYSFINKDMFDRVMLPTDDYRRNALAIANPLSEEQGVMRTLLMPGLLTTISRNLARRNQNLAFFEMGSVFMPGKEKLPSEVLKLGVAVSGHGDINWKVSPLEWDFFYLKGVLEDLFQQLGIRDARFTAGTAPGFHPGRTAVVSCGEDEVGIIGEVHPQVLDNFDIRNRVVFTELEMEKLYKHATPRVMTESIGRFPAIERDLAVLLPIEVAASEAVETMRRVGGPFLHDVLIFDLFTGGGLAQGVKSMAFRLTFQSDEGTLVDEQVNMFMEEIIKQLQENLAAKLR